MRIIFLILLSFQTIGLFGQNKISTAQSDIELIKSFIKDLSNEEIKSDVILSQYIKVDNSSDDLYDYLEVSLDEIRINLLSKKIEDIQFTPYERMPHKDVRDIDLENLTSNRIYFLQYKNRQLLAVYLEQDKIASFTLVAKGNNKAHFVLY